jgi:hypothetical protein
MQAKRRKMYEEITMFSKRNNAIHYSHPTNPIPFLRKSYPIAHRKLGQTTFQRTTSQLNMLVLVISVHIARG